MNPTKRGLKSLLDTVGPTQTSTCALRPTHASRWDPQPLLCPLVAPLPVRKPFLILVSLLSSPWVPGLPQEGSSTVGSWELPFHWDAALVSLPALLLLAGLESPIALAVWLDSTLSCSFFPLLSEGLAPVSCAHTWSHSVPASNLALGTTPGSTCKRGLPGLLLVFPLDAALGCRWARHRQAPVLPPLTSSFF